ncbi:hypothetical protein MASR2M47_35050 [Draconibacterium sp.]
MLAEYASEQNKEKGLHNPTCNDGYFGSSCGTYDPVCKGKTPKGHGSGMCQWGSARWATGDVLSSDGTKLAGAHGYGTLTWTQILSHYYPNWILSTCGSITRPDNDECSGAFPLYPTVDCNYKQYSTFGATQSLPAESPCNGFTKGIADDDVWFSFAATAGQTYTVRLLNGTSFDGVLNLRQGSCNGSSIACDDQTGSTGVLNTVKVTASTNQTYYVRVYHYGSGSGGGSFQICVTQSSTSLPDLKITANTQSVSPTSVSAGSYMTASCSEDNNGNAVAGSNHVTLWLSSNNVLSESSDTYLGQIAFSSLAALSNSIIRNTSVQIPSNTSPGNYYLFFWADGNKVVTESDDDNNYASVQITVTSNCITPGIPATAKGTVTGTTTADLTWTEGNPAGSSTVTYYWAVGTSSSVTYGNGVAQSTTTGTTATVTGLTSGTKYYLRVYARTSCDGSESGYKTSMSFTTDASSFPSLALSTNSLPDFGNIAVNTTSSAQSFTLSGSNLTGNIFLSAPAGFEISKSSNSGFGPSLSLTQSGGSVFNTTIYVRFSPTSAGVKSGEISVSSTGATTQKVSVIGTGTQSCTPPNNVSAPSNQTVSAPDGASFSVTALGSNNLYRWEMSEGFTWHAIPNNSVYSNSNTSTLRINSTTAAMNGYQYRCVVSSTCNSTVTTSKDAKLYVTSCTVPTTQASGLTFSSVGANSMTLYCSLGNGSRRVVKINKSNSFTAPASGTDPNANTSYSGSGEQVVYNGTGNLVTITGLTAGTTYWFRVYEANCTGSSSLYSTATGSNNPSSQSTATTCVAPSNGIISPSNPVVTAPNNISLTVTANGSTPFEYQWYWWNGSNWTALTNSSPYSGVTTNTLKINPTSTSMDGYFYTCVIGNACGNQNNITAVQISVNTSTPTITVSNSSLPDFGSTQVNTTSTAQSFTVSGSNLWANVLLSAPTSFEISKSSGSGYGASLSLTQTGGSVSNTTIYVRFIPTSAGAKSGEISVSSTGATTQKISVSGTGTQSCIPPGNVSTPSNQTVTAPAGTSFSISASGSHNVYRWEMSEGFTWHEIPNNSVYSNINTSTLKINSTTAVMNGYQYRCVVWTSCNSTVITSKDAKLYVNNCISPNVSVNSPSGSSPLTMTCTATGGSGGSIAYKWYSGTSCSGSVLGTGSTLAVTANGYYSCKAYIVGSESTCYNCAYGYATIMTQTCTDWSVSPSTQSVPASGGSYQATVSANGSCTYNVTFNNDWIHFVNYLGSGNFAYSVDANNTGNSRTGTVSINNATDGINDITTLTIVQDGACSLFLSSNMLDFTNTAGNKSVNVTSNSSWTVSDDATWISVSPPSSSNNGTLTVSVTANTGAERTGTVTVSGCKSTKTISITQTGTCSLAFSKPSLDFTSSSSNNTVNVSSNSSWTVNDDASWITVSQTSGSNNATLTISVSNNSGAERSGTVTVSGCNTTKTITVIQVSECILSLGISNLDFSTSPGGKSFKVNSNSSWTASADSSWISVLPVASFGNKSVVISVKENKGVSRVGIVTFSGCNQLIYLAINQNGKVTAIGDVIVQGQVKVYPNPTTGIITIEGLPDNENVEIAIYDVNRKLIKKQTASSSVTRMDISNVVSGTYLLIIDDHVNETFKIIKE